MIPYLRITCIILLSFFYKTSINSQNSSHYYKNKDLPCLDKKFTVSYHWIKDSLNMPPYSDGLVDTVVQKLNDAFSPICVSFEICKKEIIPWFEFDTISTVKELVELDKRVHDKFRINLYLVSESKIGDCGWANLNDITIETGAVVMAVKGCFKDFNILPNLMGTILGLYNTSETKNGTELVNGSNCATTGDKICDTPADPGYQYDKMKCTLPNNIKDSNGEYFAPDISNFMSIYYGCQCKFTRDQYIVMANSYLNSARKNW